MFFFRQSIIETLKHFPAHALQCRKLEFLIISSPLTLIRVLFLLADLSGQGAILRLKKVGTKRETIGSWRTQRSNAKLQHAES